MIHPRPLALLLAATSLSLTLASLPVASAELQSVTLADAWQLDIPASAKAIPERPVPMYVMEQEEILIILGAMPTEDCGAFLDQTLQQGQQAQQDPKASELMQLELSITEISGHPAVYSHGGMRNPKEAEAGEPMHPMGSLVFCVSDNQALSVTLSPRTGDFDDTRRALLDQIAGSARALGQ